MPEQTSPQRVTDPDGRTVEIFALPMDADSLKEVLRNLFEAHWADISFGPIIQAAAWEIRAPHAPTHVDMLHGYLTVAFGASHFHLCIGPTHGPRHDPTSAALAQYRRTARAELYRQLDHDGAPVSWGLRLLNGRNEQQITVLLPNPFLALETGRVSDEPDWSRLALWDALRRRWTGANGPDTRDRSGRRFTH